MANERTGLGTTFLRETAADSSVFTAIAQVATITPPQLTRETVDVEELAPADDFKKKLVGLIDGGEFSVTLNFDPDEESHKDLERTSQTASHTTTAFSSRSTKRSIPTVDITTLPAS